MVARHSLLVVDDELDVVHSLQDLLRFDYRVLGASRASEAFGIMDREDVQIVMSDQRMPEMEGVEFLASVREKHPDAIRLLFTGYADLRAVVGAINEGHIFRYITKPWDAEELQTVLRQAAERYDLLLERKQLLAEVQEQNRRLETMNAELRQADALKLGFIKVVSHELRTPLTIVLGLSELARKENTRSDSLPEWLEQIHTGSLRLSELVDRIIQLLLSGKFERPQAWATVLVDKLLLAAAEEVTPFVTRRRQTLNVLLPNDLGVVRVEPDKLTDSLTHLLLNAIKFTPDGGLITLEAERLVMGEVVIRVRDSGVGIANDELKHVFDPFFTGFDVSRHCSGVYEHLRKGLGVGLTLVKAFVEMQGGRVDVKSAIGQGSTFTITLPNTSYDSITLP